MTDTLDRQVADAMIDAAQRAILPRFVSGQAIAAEYKSIGEAVTVADRESESILADHLAQLIPGAAIVGEEAVHDDPSLLGNLANGTCWIIDPLDGTGNFAKGVGPFGILVALAENGIPVGGWIFDPINGRFCSAQAGKGAWIDGASFTTPKTRNTHPLLAVTRLFASNMQREALLDTLRPHCTVVDSPRCAADQYPRVALGGNDATLFTRTIAWDHAAGVIFLNEAGGFAARQDASHYRCEAPDDGLIIATSKEHWERVAAMLDRDGLELAGAHLASG